MISHSSSESVFEGGEEFLLSEELEPPESGGWLVRRPSLPTEEVDAYREHGVIEVSARVLHRKRDVSMEVGRKQSVMKA